MRNTIYGCENCSKLQKELNDLDSKIAQRKGKLLATINIPNIKLANLKRLIKEELTK